MSSRPLVRSVGGLLGWAVAFALVYGLHGVGCAAGWDLVDLGPVSLHRTLLVAAWVACMLLLALWLWRVRHRCSVGPPATADGAGGLLQRLAELCAWVGLAATFVSLLPVATHGLCL